MCTLSIKHAKWINHYIVHSWHCPRSKFSNILKSKFWLKSPIWEMRLAKNLTYPVNKNTDLPGKYFWELRPNRSFTELKFLLLFQHNLPRQIAHYHGYRCSLCHKQLSTDAGWQRHRRQHMGQFKYTCQVCGQGFMQRSHYMGHMNRHNNIITLDHLYALCAPRASGRCRMPHDTCGTYTQTKEWTSRSYKMEI